MNKLITLKELAKDIAPKTVNERVQALRGRMRAQGYVLRQLWVHPDDWGRVKAYIERVNRQRLSQQSVTPPS